jgi:hypothetical protein
MSAIPWSSVFLISGPEAYQLPVSGQFCPSLPVYEAVGISATAGPHEIPAAARADGLPSTAAAFVAARNHQVNQSNNEPRRALVVCHGSVIALLKRRNTPFAEGGRFHPGGSPCEFRFSALSHWP